MTPLARALAAATRFVRVLPPSSGPAFPFVPPRCSHYFRGVRCGQLLDDCPGHRSTPNPPTKGTS